MLELGVGTGAGSDHPGGLGYTMLTHTRRRLFLQSRPMVAAVSETCAASPWIKELFLEGIPNVRGEAEGA